MLRNKYLKITLLLALSIGFAGCGGGDSGDSENPSETLQSITHNGITYNIVLSPYTGKYWLDKNLGASTLCTQRLDINCFGDYYQWGRLTDAHEKIDSNVSSQTIDVSLDSTNEYFISAAGISDWTTLDEDGSQRSFNWSKIDGIDMCPIGFRVPTADEFKAETIDQGIDTREEAFDSFLKLPTASYRDRQTAINISLFTYNQTGVVPDGTGYYWTNTPELENNPLNLNYSHFIVFDLSETNSGVKNYGHRAEGLSIRCIKD